MKISKSLLNPYGMYNLVFLSAIALYALPWSTKYPNLTLELILFLLSTFTISTFLYIVTKSSNLHNWIDSAYEPPIKNHLIVYATLITLNIWYIGHLPILGSIGEIYNYNPKDVEYFPLIYPLSMTFFYCYGLYFFYLYLNNGKVKYILLFILFLLPMLGFLQRGILFSTLTTAFIIYICKFRILKLKRIFIFITFIAFGIFAFGEIGSIRESNRQYYRPITEIGSASEEFNKLKISDNVFYVWLYFTSPLANLQENVNLSKTVLSTQTLQAFIASEIMPDVISKRLYGTEEIASLETNFADYRIEPTLNVGTMYTRSFSYLGYTGIILLYTYFASIIFISLKLLSSIRRHKSPFIVIGNAFLCNFALLMVFDNMIPNTSRFLPLIFPLAMTMLWKFKIL